MVFNPCKNCERAGIGLIACKHCEYRYIPVSEEPDPDDDENTAWSKVMRGTVKSSKSKKYTNDQEIGDFETEDEQLYLETASFRQLLLEIAYRIKNRLSRH